MTIPGPRSPRSRSILGVSILSLLSLTAAYQATGQTTFTNTAGGNTWSTAGNWDAGEPTAILDAILPTGLVGGGILTLSAGELANSLTFNDAYTLNGGGLTLTTGDVTVAAGITANLNTVLQGTANGLTKLGTGILVLGSANTFTGPVEISAGTVSISNIDRLNLANAANTLSIGTATTAGTLDYTGNTVSMARTIALGTAGATINVATTGQTLTLTGVISGGPANAPDTATLGNTALTLSGPGKVTLSGTNTFTGNLVVDQATLVFNNNDAGLGATAAGTYKSVILQNGATFNLTTGTYNPTTGTNTANKRFVVGTGGATLDIATGAMLQLDDANQISGSAALTKAGNGVLQLSNQAFNLTGTINVTAGTLRVLGGSSGVLGTAGTSTALTIANGAVYDVQINVVAARPVTISGSGIGGTGVLTNSGTGAATIAGVVTLATDVTLGGINAITMPSLNGGGVARTITKVGLGAIVLNNAGTNFVGTTTVNTEGEFFLGHQAALGTAANITATGAVSGVVQNGAALPGYTYTVPNTGLIGGNTAFLNSLVIGTNLNVLPETLVETVTGALATTTLTIPNTASRYFGIGANLSDSVTIGTGTPWKGISSDNLARVWQTGVITANSDFEIRSTNGKGLTIGNNAATPGSVTIATANPTVASITGGNVTLAESTPAFTSNLTFQVTNGATLQTSEVNALGASTTTPANNARVDVLSGGTLNPNVGATLNGDVTIRQGGILFMDDIANFTGIGTITQEVGAITRITKDLATTGSQSPGTVAGSIVRVEANITDLDLNLDDAANYVITLATRALGNLTLNSVGNVALPGGGSTPTGMLTNDGAGRILNNLTAATLTTVTVGSGGATIAATTSSTFTIAPLAGSGGIVFNAGANKLTFGSTASVDGQNKAGAVDISGSANSGITAGSVDIVAGILQNLSGGMTYNIGGGTGITRVFSGARFTSNATTLINTNLQIDSGATAYSTATTSQISSLSGSGSAIIGTLTADTTSRTLTVGANNLSTTFSGVLSQNNTGTATGSLVKTGSGTLTLAGAADTYRGTTIVNGGTLRVENAHGSAAAPVDNYTVNVGAALSGSMANAATDRIFLASGKNVTLTGAAGGFNADPAQRATLAPGSGGLGQFNVDGGSVIFGGNSTLSIETGLAISDLLNITNGGLSLATTTDLLAVTASDAGTFTIAQWTTGLRTGFFDNYSFNGTAVSGTFDVPTNTFTAASGTFKVFYNDAANQIQLTVVPEPGALASLTGGLGLLLGASRLRRRRR